MTTYNLSLSYIGLGIDLANINILGQNSRQFVISGSLQDQNFILGTPLIYTFPEFTIDDPTCTDLEITYNAYG